MLTTLSETPPTEAEGAPPPDASCDTAAPCGLTPVNTRGSVGSAPLLVEATDCEAAAPTLPPARSEVLACAPDCATGPTARFSAPAGAEASPGWTAFATPQSGNSGLLSRSPDGVVGGVYSGRSTSSALVRGDRKMTASKGCNQHTSPALAEEDGRHRLQTAPMAVVWCVRGGRSRCV